MDTINLITITVILLL